MNDHKPQVLVIDDKENLLRLMTQILKQHARVYTAACGKDGIDLYRRKDIDVVLCDLKLPDIDGLEVLKQCKKEKQQAEFILMTAFACVSSAVEALRFGAFDYLVKPFENEHALALILNAAKSASKSHLKPGPESDLLPGIIGQSPSMRALGQMIYRVAASEATILLLGETGTGKERLARAVHLLSSRQNQKFVAVNCAAIPADLLESELFGYSKGSFTGAGQHRMGLFEEADGGTLFLDEIGELRLSLQAKLTRALELKSIRRLGESDERMVNVRIIAATHRNLKAMVASQSFREDLWYRLNVAAVQIPPLRERRDDIEVLAKHFLREFSGTTQLEGPRGISSEAMKVLLDFHWPGNVRQLRAAIERGCIIAQGPEIEVKDLPPELLTKDLVGFDHLDLSRFCWEEVLEMSRAEVARKYFDALLRRFKGQAKAAAKHAQIERESFYRLLRRYDIEISHYRTGE